MLNKSDRNESSIAYWCVVNGSELWSVNGGLPKGRAAEFNLPADKAVCVGEFENLPVMWINESDVEQDVAMVSLRDLLALPESLFLLASRAVQFGHMTQTLRFCPQCGGRNHFNHNQIAMQCTDCRTLHYPRIFPCIIVAVRKGEQILLAQHPRHRGGMYTVIAGFVEAGETLEQCVAREVKEETGIEVTNIRYFGSQPWAFPSSMMMAFLADYASGEVKPDYTELKDAGWFTPDAIPLVAPTGTIARALIDQTLENIRSDREQ